ncbi:potassium-transporting ATPase subunit C [Gordonia polyisoprenivorans NBRC 16320 = JCM 10675]|uniref:Potassium-transporting ATPase subunit C n=1 Tax=Gordonia polyisoprenivorans TaxID=84595 RepID=A0A846WKP3_9ACTN|nr:potassium-transporting ATPase subunit C [Gordonia polyisoprenivorans]NKY01799.1 potassium-transporting ATPase subunit C [Gordonia polyisoprenivorans]GAB25138.1 potassium-transporting ATPase subunit C [Gordonia polyisoprenivorans NBRC 16320 = JCM 10675]
MNTVISTFARQCVAAIGVMIALTVLLGGAYPAVVWAASRLDTHAAEGSQISDARGCNAGSSIIGIDPQPVAGQPDSFLHARVLGSSDNPMAPGDPSASASSNDGPNSQDLATMIEARRKIIAQREGVAPAAVPVDAVTGSGSGLDPDISPGYAKLQVPRIARNSGRTQAQVQAIIDKYTSGRQWGFLGQPTVDVLQVNLALGHTVCPRS